MEEIKVSQPCSYEIERAALGCMLTYSEVAEKGRQMLVPDDFYYPGYSIIFQAMQHLDAVNVALVYHQLEKQGDAERVGGLSALTDLILGVSSSVHFDDYVKELRRLSYFRRTIDSGRDMVQAAYKQDAAGIDKALSAVGQDSGSSVKFITLAEAFEEYRTDISNLRAKGKGLLGLPTGFADLDLMTSGLQDGDLIIVAGRPSMGKSAFALDLARNGQKELNREGKKVLFFSLEMSLKSLGGRGYTSDNMVPNEEFSVRGSDADWQKTLQDVEKNRDEFEKGAGQMLLAKGNSMSLDDIRAACFGARSEGIQPGLVVIDYLQLIETKGLNRVQEIAEVTRGLKLMAQNLGCPVVLLSQLSRKNEERADKRPILSDLRESGSIEQDADVVLLLHREEYYFADIGPEKRGIAEAIIAKQRNGPTCTVELCWFGGSTTFRNKEKFHKTEEEVPKEWEQQTL